MATCPGPVLGKYGTLKLLSGSTITAVVVVLLLCSPGILSLVITSGLSQSQAKPVSGEKRLDL